MHISARELTVLVPGLFGLRELGDPRAALDGLTLPALERLLARATTSRQQGASLESVLFDLSGMSAAAKPAGNLPIAPLTWLCDGDTAPRGYWLRADPVHLETGLDRLTMGRAPLVTANEARALCLAINNHCAGEDGLRLLAPVPGRWYLPLAEPPQARFAALPEVLGRDILANLPAGEQGGRWRRLLNELQMLLHRHEVNEARRAAGRPEINSLWFWGGGVLPPRSTTPPSPWRRVWSDEPLAAGLARHADVEIAPRPVDAAAWLAGAEDGRHLVVANELRSPLAFGDIESWQAALQALHDGWFAPLERALKRGEVAMLHIRAGGACGQESLGYHIGSKAPRRWWRRPRPFDHYGC